MDNFESMDLRALFKAADQIGSKYQSQDERRAFNALLKAEIEEIDANLAKSDAKYANAKARALALKAKQAPNRGLG